MKKITVLTCFAIVLLSAMLFPGCTGDKPTTDTEDEPIVVRSRLRSEPNKLNPILTVQASSLQVINMLFPSLLNFNPESHQLEPMLAKSRPSMELLTEGPYKGGAAYTYEILDEATWDNGQPVQASDYAFSLKALFNPNVAATAYQSILGFIRDIELDPDNPKRFTIYTDKLFRSEAGSGFYVYPEHVYDPNKMMQKYSLADLTDTAQKEKHKADTVLQNFATAFNKLGSPGTLIESCGAYKVVEWETGQHVILEKKKDWWGEKLMEKYPLLAAYPDEIIFKIIPDNVAAITAMKDGQLDAIGNLPTSIFKEFQASEAAAGFNFHTPEMMTQMYMAINTRRSHLADKRVRLALAYLTDVDEIIESIQLGLAVPAVGAFPNNAPYYNKSLKRIPFNVEKAKALLEEAGWKDTDGNGTVDKVIDGKKTEMNVSVLVTTSGQASKGIAAILTEDARKAGVAIETVAVTPQELFRERLPSRNFDIFMAAAGFDLDMFDPGQFWHTSSDTPSGQNRVGFGNSQTDAIIDEIRATSDEARRTELYLQLQEIIYDEQPFIFLYFPKDRIIFSKKFEEAKTSLRRPGYFENHFR